MEKIFIDKDIYIKQYESSELKAYYQLFTDNLEVLKSVEMNSALYDSLSEVESWLDSLQQDHLPNYMIWDKSTSKLIGRVSLYNCKFKCDVYENVKHLNFENKIVPAWSIILDTNYSGRSLMTKALQTIEKKYSREYDLFLWEAKSMNKISNHLASKLGYDKLGYTNFSLDNIKYKWHDTKMNVYYKVN